MKKKTILLSYLPVITIAAGLIVSWAKFSVQAETTVEKLGVDTKAEIDKVKTDIIIFSSLSLSRQFSPLSPTL